MDIYVDIPPVDMQICVDMVCSLREEEEEEKGEGAAIKHIKITTVVK